MGKYYILFLISKKHMLRKMSLQTICFQIYKEIKKYQKEKDWYE